MPDVFYTDCGGPYDLTPAHTISNWEAMPTSGAEVAIMEFLKSQPHRYEGKRLLHIGTGNCSLPVEFAPKLDEYVGVTISLPEIALFKRKCAHLDNSSVVMLNKYDYRMYGLVHGNFDVIIDNTLKSYACCEKHFELMMSFFASILELPGSIITTETGILFGWPGNTKSSYTPGAQLDPALAQSRALGHDGLGRLADRLGLALSSEPVPKTQPPLQDRILILTKH